MQNFIIFLEKKTSSLSIEKEQMDSVEERDGIGSYGSNVAVVGNKIELQTNSSTDSASGINGLINTDVTMIICKEKENSGR